MPDYDGEINKCNDFITNFQDATITRDKEDPIHGKLKYMTRLQQCANKKTDTIEIELEDIREFFDSAKDQGFVERVRTNTSRYIHLFSTIIDKNLPQPSIDISDENLTSFEITMQQRRFNAANQNQFTLNSGF